MERRLKVITLPDYKDALRTVVTEDGANMALFNPEDNSYKLKGNELFYRDVPLNLDNVIDLVSNGINNKPIHEQVLVYALWTFLRSDQFDLRNNDEFVTTVNEFSNYFGISTGNKGFRLVEKLETFQHVYGVIAGKGVFPLLQVSNQQEKLILKSRYLHLVFNMILNDSIDERGITRKLYETDKVHAKLLTVKNRVTAMIVIELVRLIVTSGKNGFPHIRVERLAQYIPQLRSIWLSGSSTSQKNRKLQRIFKGVAELLEQRTEIWAEFNEVKVSIPQIKISNMDAVIKINHNGIKLKKE